MNNLDALWRLVEIGLHLLGAMAFLLVGWRFGRESAGRPLFDYPVLPADTTKDALLEEADPWSAASIAASPLDRRPEAVDIFETLRPAGRQQSPQRYPG
jgi:hypothetical protein